MKTSYYVKINPQKAVLAVQEGLQIYDVSARKL